MVMKLGQEDKAYDLLFKMMEDLKKEDEVLYVARAPTKSDIVDIKSGDDDGSRLEPVFRVKS